MKSFTGAFLVLMLAAPATLARVPRHAVSTPVVDEDAVTLEKFNTRLEQGAVRLQKIGAYVERSIEYDVAFPDDLTEVRQMNGYAILLVSALTHKAGELPLARVYLSNGKAQTPLRLLGQVTRQNPPSSAAAKLYGPYRNDAFYLLPLDQVDEGSKVIGDFAKKSRDGFIIVDSGLAPPDYGARVKSGGPPPRQIVQRLIDREYPGFGIVPDLK